ncbi:hypothetical protein A2230_02900 [candidate division WOR-1 bacterium RIFOXYA2_FULL_36_21]|uniref:Uncharacterized protein n=1 Tax=candidate division WOR-1 bacterium RIFOXYB2_FULL_36_35 TaxID=1802578 RepID=A0A1F4S3Z6_UNCSA|nr:MAG: hypothetical protein A2230_02900 [candidate division WOR-1 bacterium RIFOXYA2_FULL_36_21]OGC15146.1 MAG: hypothetical protein A2282_09040 [candidate division WOR-1 bacterium RIFOXYA12_FULL_36_13]OGC15154.1 MAG: hypothetical protein A2290_08810 [candidate division WOR-1 bacterium RIFOXYB2_FULL_36_35]
MGKGDVIKMSFSRFLNQIDLVRRVKGMPVYTPPTSVSTGPTRRSILKAAGIGLVLTAAGTPFVPFVLEECQEPIEVIRTSSFNSIDKNLLIDGWFRAYETPLNSEAGSPLFIVDREKDVVPSESMHWGLEAARIRQDQEKFDRFLSGIFEMMERGLPAWQGYIENGRFNIANYASAMDADVGIATELIKASELWGSEGRFNYAKISKQFIDMIWNTYVNTNGVCATLAPTPYDKSTNGSFVRNISYVSIAMLEMIKGFDGDHDWALVIECEQKIREEVLAATSYKAGKDETGKELTTADNFSDGQWERYTHIPDLIEIVPTVFNKDGELVNRYAFYTPSDGRSFRFGRDALRTIVQIAIDASYCSDPVYRKRNVDLAKRMLKALFPNPTDENAVKGIVDSIVFHGYDGSPDDYKNGGDEKRRADQDVLYAAYASLAYAAGFDDLHAILAKPAVARLNKSLKSGFTRFYYQESSILRSVCMACESFWVNPASVYVEGESKDIQSLHIHRPFILHHLQNFPFYKGPFKTWWSRTPAERAISDLMVLVDSTKHNLTWYQRPFVSTKLLSADVHELQRLIDLGGKLKAVRLMEGAWFRYGEALEKSEPWKNPLEVSAALSGLQGTFKDGVFSPFTSVRIVARTRRLAEARWGRENRNPFIEIGLAQAFIDVNRDEFVRDGLELVDRLLSDREAYGEKDSRKGKKEVLIRASMVYAEGYLKEAEYAWRNNRDLAVVDERRKKSEEYLAKAFEEATSQLKELETTYSGLTLLRDGTVDQREPIGEEFEKFEGFISSVSLQQADLSYRIAELEGRDYDKRIEDYKKTISFCFDVLNSKGLNPDSALSSVSKIINAYNRMAVLSRDEAEAAADENKYLGLAEKYFNEAKIVVDIAIPVLVDRRRLNDPDGVLRGIKTILEGKPDASFLDIATSAFFENAEKVFIREQLSQLKFRVSRLAVLNEMTGNDKQKLQQMAEDVDEIILASPFMRVRSHVERILTFLNSGDYFQARLDCSIIERAVKTVSNAVNTPSDIDKDLIDFSSIAKFRTLSFMSRNILALASARLEQKDAIIRDIKGNLEHLYRDEIEKEKDLTVDEKESKLKKITEVEVKKIIEAVNILYPQDGSLVRDTNVLNRERRKIGKIFESCVVIVDDSTQKWFFWEAFKRLDSGEYLAASQIFERGVEYNAMLTGYKKELIEGKKERVEEELTLLAKVKNIRETIKAGRIRGGDPVVIAASLYEEILDTFADQKNPYTSDWFKEIVGAYEIVAWAMFNSGDIAGREGSLTMMKELLNEDHADNPIHGNKPQVPNWGKIAQDLMTLIRDKEIRGSINQVLTEQPYVRIQILETIGDICSSRSIEGYEKVAIEYYGKAMGLYGVTWENLDASIFYAEAESIVDFKDNNMRKRLRDIKNNRPSEMERLRRLLYTRHGIGNGEEILKSL